jgi:hypothetical protein
MGIENLLLFGKKENFAIEIGATKNVKKFKIRFWVEGKSIGSFTKSGELKHSISEYKKFVHNKESYYLSLFDHLTFARIHYYLTDISLLLSDNDEDLAEFEIRKKFYRFFGDQFSNDSSIILLYKESIVIFLVTKNGSEKIEHYQVEYEKFDNVFREYIAYCELHKLI